jgi:hypothetical protein
MTVHKHVLVFENDWFTCEGCAVRVEVVPLFEPSPEGVKVIASVRVRNAGRGGFTLDEMSGLARFWLKGFRRYVEQQENPKRSGRRSRRQLVSMTDLQVVGVWADKSGVDRSAA